MAGTDLRVDQNFNPVIVNGDIDIEEGTLTDANLILGSNPGDFKEDPFIGVGLPTRINGDETPDELIAIDKDIRTQLEYDGIPHTVDTTTQPIKVSIDG